MAILLMKVVINVRRYLGKVNVFFCQILIKSNFLNRSSKTPHFANICPAGRTDKTKLAATFYKFATALKTSTIIIIVIIIIIVVTVVLR